MGEEENEEMQEVPEVDISKSVKVEKKKSKRGDVVVVSARCSNK